MLFEQIRCGGCLSYLIGCDETCGAMLVDPHLELLDRYLVLAAERGMRIHYICETHTHADHFSAARELAKRLDAKVVMHRLSAAPFADVRVDDGESLIVGFTEGVIGMRVGGTRRLVIPPQLGYGNDEQGVIPAGAVLIFRVELLAVSSPTPD